MNKFDTATPYVASYVILRKSGKVAFVLRANTGWMNGYYGLPSGKVEKGENFIDAAIREAREEVGIEVSRGGLKHLLTVHRSEGNDWVDVYFEAINWRGEPFNAEPEVHSELAWLDLDNLPKNIIPSVRHAMKEIRAGKYYSEFGW